jgi:dihydroorotate dehydrogenase electron transfer subunit
MAEMYDEIVAVTENRPLTGGHFLVSFYAPRQAQATRPGQFAMVRLLGQSDVLLRRPMSIYDVAARDGIEPRMPRNASTMRGQSRIASHRSKRRRGFESPEIIRMLYKIVGRGTRLMAELKPGDSVGLAAPLGQGFFAEERESLAEQADHVLLVAGGIGIAALLMPARELARAGIGQDLFFGARSRADLVGVSDFEPWVKAVTLATENGSRGHRGYITRPLANYLERRRGRRFLLMVCGPWGMLRASAELAKKYGHLCLVSMENRMGCGLGVCLGCSIRVEGTGHEAYSRVCTEGPVFDARRVVWDREEIPKI